MRYEDLTAADDGNQDKASISDASDLPSDLSRCVPNAIETFHENKLQNDEKRASRKTTSPRKRSRNSCMSGENSEAEADKRSEKEERSMAWPAGELLEPDPIKSEQLFDLEELIRSLLPHRCRRFHCLVRALR